MPAILQWTPRDCTRKANYFNREGGRSKCLELRTSGVNLKYQHLRIFLSRSLLGYLLGSFQGMEWAVPRSAMACECQHSMSSGQTDNAMHVSPRLLFCLYEQNTYFCAVFTPNSP
eukprot:830060-Amphidinium_carterae.1